MFLPTPLPCLTSFYRWSVAQPGSHLWGGAKKCVAKGGNGRKDVARMKEAKKSVEPGR